MSNAAGTNAGWQDCPAGELRRLAHHLRAQKRYQAAKTVTLYAAPVLLAAALAVHFYPHHHMSTAGGIDCTVCEAHLQEFYDHLVRGAAFDPQLARRMRLHLLECNCCRERLEAIDPNALQLIDPKVAKETAFPRYRTLLGGRWLLPRHSSLKVKL